MKKIKLYIRFNYNLNALQEILDRLKLKISSNWLSAIQKIMKKEKKYLSVLLQKLIDESFVNVTISRIVIMVVLKLQGKLLENVHLVNNLFIRNNCYVY